VSRGLVVALLAAWALAAPAAEYVIRDPQAVKELLAVQDTVAFKDAQLSAILDWLNARYQIETAMGLDARGEPDVEHAVDVQPTLTIQGAMPLSELLDLAAAGTGWTWSINADATVVFLPPPAAPDAAAAEPAPAPSAP
jgi:hypothetical protein